MIEDAINNSRALNQRWFGGDDICTCLCKKFPRSCRYFGIVMGVIIFGLGIGVIATKGEGTTGGTTTGIVMVVIGALLFLWQYFKKIDNEQAPLV